MGFILAFLALFLFVLVYLIEGIVILFIGVENRKWYKVTSHRKFMKAFKVDVFGNYLFADFWNAALSKNGYQFGVFGETLSSCFGKKRLEKSLNWFGWCISVAIDAVDFTKWFKGGHCKASIMNDQEIADFLNR